MSAFKSICGIILISLIVTLSFWNCQNTDSESDSVEIITLTLSKYSANPGDSIIATVLFKMDNPIGKTIEWSGSIGSTNALNASQDSVLWIIPTTTLVSSASIEVTITDIAGNADSKDTTIIINQQQNCPELTSLNPEHAQGRANEKLSFLATAISNTPSAGPHYEWFTDCGTFEGSTNSNTATVILNNQLTSCIVVACVTDANNECPLDCDTAYVDRIENICPEIDTLIIGRNSASPGDTIPVKVIATDAENDSLTYQWISSPAPYGTFTTNDTSSTLWIVPLVSDTTTFEICVVVTDGYCPARICETVIVYPILNQCPIATDFYMPEIALMSGQSMEVKVTAYDPDGDELSYQWYNTDPPGSFSSPDSSSTYWTAPSVSATTMILICVVINDGVCRITVCDSVYIRPAPENHCPEILRISLSPDTLAPEDTLRLASEAIDADGDSLTFTWNTLDGGSFLSRKIAKFSAGDTKDGKTARWIPPIDIGEGIHIFRFILEVSDGKCEPPTSQTDSIVVIVARNNCPKANRIISDPDTICPGKLTRLEVFTSDADGDDLLFEWFCSLNTIGNFSNPNDSITNWTLTGDPMFNRYCDFWVKVSDGKCVVFSDTIQVYLLTSCNNCPTLGITAQQIRLASPSYPFEEGDTLFIVNGGLNFEFKANASDPDRGDILTYDWTWTEGTGTPDRGTLDWQSPIRFTGVKKITITCSVSDGKCTKKDVFDFYIIY